jgi:hypothetical protein
MGLMAGALVVLGGAAGAAWQRAGARGDERRLPPRGELFVVDGRLCTCTARAAARPQ